MFRQFPSTAFVAVALAGALVTLAACKEDKPAPAVTPAAPAPVASPTPPPSAAPTPTAATTAETSAGKMTHCPSTVAGAKTSIKETKTGVELTVTTANGADVAEIRTRARFLADTVKNATPEVLHNGSGEGGGSFGRCPVVLRRTAVEASDVEGGAKLAINATDPKEVGWLQRETKERHADLAKPGASEAGQKHMANCPSAVKGAKTAVSGAKDAVEVTVTAADEAAQKEIRERAKRLVEAAKADAKQVLHTGMGSGGGELGRCPVVLADTTVSTKDVAGGSTLTVKPIKSDRLAKLKQEITERTSAF